MAFATALSCASPAAHGGPAPGTVAPVALPPIADPVAEPAPQAAQSVSPPPTSSSPAPAPPKELPKFDSAAAEAAIRALDFDSCITDPSLHFDGYVERTFTPNGRSPGGRLHMAFTTAGRPDPSMSKCVSALLHTLHVAEFGGSAMQVRGDFTIKNQTLRWKGPFTVRSEPPAESD